MRIKTIRPWIYSWRYKKEEEGLGTIGIKQEGTALNQLVADYCGFSERSLFTCTTIVFQVHRVKIFNIFKGI